MDVRPLNFEEEDEHIVVASVSENGWLAVYGCKEYLFPQFAQFRVKRSEGEYLLARAENEFRGRAEQRRSERSEWARKISSLNQRQRDLALQFCDAEGNPRSKEMKVIPLLNLTSDEGRKIYQQAYDEAKAAGKKPQYIKVREQSRTIAQGYNPDPDAGDITRGESDRFRREAFDETERVPPPPATELAQVEPTEEEAPDRPIKVPKPTAEWLQSDLVKFCQSKGFTVATNVSKDHEKLLDLATRAHADHLKRLTAGGFKYEEV